MRYEKLKNVPRGEFLKRKPEHNKVSTRGEYDRSFKKYRIDDWEDISRDMLVDGEKLVWVGFTY